MKPIDLLKFLGNVKDSYVISAQEFRQCRKESRVRNLPAKRFWLIAAAIALTLLLVGCAVVYMLRMQDLKIGEHTMIQTEPEAAENSEITLDILSLQGIKDSPNYRANQEWLAFTQSYEPEFGDYWESEEQYWAYNVLDQTMVDKLNEICEKYNLEVIGKPWHEYADCNEFLPLIGVDSLLKTGSEATLHIPQGRFFPGGSFTIYGSVTVPGTTQPLDITYHCAKKNVFYDVFAYVSPDTNERNYETADGIPLLLLESEHAGMILADREDCFISLSVELRYNTSLEHIADQFDFTICSVSPDSSGAEARQQASIDIAYGDGPDKDMYSRSTYREYVEDILWWNNYNIMKGLNPAAIPQKEYTFWDLDGNGTEELLILYKGKIQNVVGMKNGKTDEGKSYSIVLCQDNILVEQVQLTLDECWYHIFRFANDGDPVFSNPKEQSIVRLKEVNGVWWRTSSTDHYAEFDTQITEAEAMEILNTYIPVTLDTKPLTEFEEP